MTDSPRSFPPEIETMAREKGWTFLFSAVIFCLVSLVFMVSPVTQMGDSRYTLVISDNLIKGKGLFLEDMVRASFPPLSQESRVKDLYRHFVQVEGHLYYFYPAGSSILSVPLVAIADLMGARTLNSDGSYNLHSEAEMQHVIASLLMGVMASICFLLSLFYLDRRTGAMAALLAVFGSQVWSSASRALWSDTWGVLILSVLILLIVRARKRNEEIQPYAAATMIAWLFFVRPTYSVAIVTIGVFFWFCSRKSFLRFIVTGLIWLGLFLLYSQIVYRHVLPPNYTQELSLNSFWVGLWGTLISPSRGLFVFVPSTVVVFYALAKSWNDIQDKPLAYLSIATIALLTGVNAAWPCWWGGDCYGARLMTGAVPWFFLLAVLAFEGLRRRAARPGNSDSNAKRLIELSIAALLLIFGVFINGRGATAIETNLWNTYPSNVRERLWDWKYPQFLAGIAPIPTRPGESK